MTSTGWLRRSTDSKPPGDVGLYSLVAEVLDGFIMGFCFYSVSNNIQRIQFQSIHDIMMVPQDTFYISVDASVASVAVVDGHSLSVAVVLDAVGEVGECVQGESLLVGYFDPDHLLHDQLYV